MLIAARLLAGALGLFMLYFVLSGLLGYPEFYWPDLAMGIILIVAALLPARLASGGLLLGGAYALGVYAVAVANQLELGQPVNPPLIISIVAVLAFMALAAFTRVRP